MSATEASKPDENAAEPEGMNLTAAEADSLALRLVARFIATDQEWLLWENVPSLGEHSFFRLLDAVERLGADLHDRSNQRDSATGSDSRYLFEQAAR